jgi:putative phosphoesterase
MKIGVISDTHDQYECIYKAVRILNHERVSFTVHCGDWVSPFSQEFFKDLQNPLRGIFGNNDGDKYYHLSYSEKTHIRFGGATLSLKVDGRTIFVCHGENADIVHALVISGIYDAVFHGHTHIPVNKLIGNTLLLNPGTFMPVTDTKIKGASCAIYDTKDNTAKIITL